MSTVVASVAVGVAVLLNICATVLLARSDLATPAQKFAQYLMIWTLPFIGAITVIAVAKETYFGRPRSRSAEAGGDVWMPGMGPEFSRGDVHHSADVGVDVGHGGDAAGGGH